MSNEEKNLEELLKLGTNLTDWFYFLYASYFYIINYDDKYDLSAAKTNY